MKLSKKAEYALRALINMGIAEAQGLDSIAGAELAQADRLPLKYLERILQQLRSAGIVDTRRGKLGGYALAMPAADIGIGNVIRIMEDRVAPISCASECAYEACSCPDEAHCGLRMLMVDVRNAIVSIVDRYSLADIVEVTLRKYRREGVLPPFSKDSAAIPAVAAGAPSKGKADPAEGFLSLFRESPSYPNDQDHE